VNALPKQWLTRLFTSIGYAVFTGVILMMVLECGSFALLSLCHWVWPDTEVNFAEMNPAYKSYSWAPEFWKEEKSRWQSQHGGYEPFRIWGVAPWHSKYINTDDTQNGSWRRTINPAGCSNHARIDVWMFGGSTLFGTGVPDWATIPSFLSEQLNSAGLGCVVVTNFGTEGYVTNQELILLIQQLKAGGKPRMVVFYDGVNDSYAGAVSPGVPTAHVSFASIKARVEGSFVGRVDFLRDSHAFQLAMMAINYLHRNRVVMGAEPDDAKAQATLDNYEANLQIARTLGAVYDFQVLSFWQPALVYGRKTLSEFEMKIAANANNQSAFRRMASVYQQAERRAAIDRSFLFLGGDFDRCSDTLYIDRWMHLTPTGNEIVARSLVGYIEDSLESSNRP
jgi:lysophospholipase L1-like esterase